MRLFINILMWRILFRTTHTLLAYLTNGRRQRSTDLTSWLRKVRDFLSLKKRPSVLSFLGMPLLSSAQPLLTKYATGVSLKCLSKQRPLLASTLKGLFCLFASHQGEILHKINLLCSGVTSQLSNPETIQNKVSIPDVHGTLLFKLFFFLTFVGP